MSSLDTVIGTINLGIPAFSIPAEQGAERNRVELVQNTNIQGFLTRADELHKKWSDSWHLE